MSGLAIRKWYLDAVAADGRAWVFYWMSVRMGPVRLAVSSALESAPGQEARTRTSLSGCDEARERGGVVEWSHEGFGVRGVWTGMFPAVERELLGGDRGKIRWRCVAPGASVELDVGGERVRALGYAEVMEMTAAPWGLPIRELRWGRAVGESGSVVWIDWRGERARTDVFVDGAAVPARVGDDGVEGKGWSLRLARDRTVRNGAIGTTALAGVPGIGSWAPARFLATNETKWVSRAEFAGVGRAWSGWAIHEVVRFAEPER